MRNIQFTALIVTSSILLGACSLLQQNAPQSPEPAPSVRTQTTPGQQTTTAEQETTGIPDASESERYITYSPQAIAQATENGGKAILFFHATWCPTCRAANEDILSRLDEIPSNITIIKTDYDTYDELKRKYNITYQHTFVQVDSQGNEITTWNGGDVDEILRNTR